MHSRMFARMVVITLNVLVERNIVPRVVLAEYGVDWSEWAKRETLVKVTLWENVELEASRGTMTCEVGRKNCNSIQHEQRPDVTSFCPTMGTHPIVDVKKTFTRTDVDKVVYGAGAVEAVQEYNRAHPQHRCMIGISANPTRKLVCMLCNSLATSINNNCKNRLDRMFVHT